ncbi:HK97 gp10 family phage protein [Inquilinus ginsengisoli]|jgi:HK97 gp10 family phage protein|uniref:HK97-gp10 family putative phage morphogenesis protein n=1 Tax=Inquilinus ginsengisoli TaxID=363840 RepID=UPI003D1BF84C
MARITGADRSLRRLARMGPAMRVEIDKALAEAARRIRAEARARLQKTPGGAEVEVTVSRRDELAVDVIAAGPGAAELEYGTAGTAARPFLRPAVEAVRADIDDLIARAVRKATR